MCDWDREVENTKGRGEVVGDGELGTEEREKKLGDNDTAQKLNDRDFVVEQMEGWGKGFCDKVLGVR